MKKLPTIIIGTTIFIFGGIVGNTLVPLTENYLSKKQPDPILQDNISEISNFSNDSKLEKDAKSNAFFDFFKKFNSDGEFYTDGAVPTIEFADIFRSIAIVKYPFSQDGWKYGVYDYGNNFFYPDFGIVMMEDEEVKTVNAIMGEDRVLIHTSSPKGQYFELVNFRTRQVEKKILIPRADEGYYVAFTSNFLGLGEYEGLRVSLSKRNEDNSRSSDEFFIVPKEDYRIIPAREFYSKGGN